MKEDFNKIKTLELELLKPEIRKDKKRLGEILADDFIEFTSLGTVINKKDVLKSLSKESHIKWEISNFKIKNISKEIVLVTYKAKKIDLKNKKIIFSLRSSVWKIFNNNWQMIFHQGTLIK